MNALPQALGFGLHMSGVMLQMELATLASLQNSYGGGYEIAVSVEGRFRKLDDVTYLFWQATTDGPEVRVSRLPRQAFRYVYRDDLLVIRSVAFNDPGSVASAGDCQRIARMSEVTRKGSTTLGKNRERGNGPEITSVAVTRSPRPLRGR
jgi:hypothetical protein